jgi:integral membrane protein
MKKTTLEKFRLINFIEGISFILLIFVAMPLKYMMGIAVATKIMGMAHGVLFIIWIILLATAHDKYKFKVKFTLLLFIASLIPFGTKFTDKMLDNEKIKENCNS